MAKGYFLSDVSDAFKVDKVSIERVPNYSDYANDKSDPENVMHPGIFFQWVSAQVNTTSAQKVWIKIRTTASFRPSRIALIDVQVLGEKKTVTRQGVTQSYLASLDGTAPTCEASHLANTATNPDTKMGPATVNLHKHTYLSTAYSGRDFPAPIAIYRGDCVMQADDGLRRTFNSNDRIELSFRAYANHSLRVGRILMGYPYSFPRNFNKNFVIERVDPLLFEREEGRFTLEDRLPSFRRARFRFEQVPRQQMLDMTAYYRLHGGTVPLLLFLDPDIPETLIYGRFTSWRDTWTHKREGVDYHNIDISFEEVSR